MLMMMMEQQHGQQKRRQEKEEEEEEKQKEIEEEEEEDEEEEMMLPGFRFHPTDEELVSFYLRRKVQHKPISIELIKQLDIYKYDPWDLPKMASIGEKEWYFYCPRDRKYRNSARPNRVTSAGFWKATGTDRPIYASSGNSSSKPRCIGLKKSLVFYTGRAAKGLKTDWMMHEFRLPPPPLPPPSSNSGLKNHLSPAESWAICRIFRKNTASHHHHQRPLSLAPAPSLSWAEIESSRTEQEQASTSSNLSSQSQSQSQGSDAMAVGMGMNMSMNMNMGMGMGMGFFYSHHTQSNPSIISSCSEASDSFNCAAPSSEQQHVQVQVQDAFAAAMPMPMTFPCHLFDVFRGSIANAASPWDSPSLDVSATNASSA